MSSLKTNDDAGGQTVSADCLTPLPVELDFATLVIRNTLAVEQFREHISRVLHDEVGQLLSATLLNLEYWRDQPMPTLERAALVADVKQALVLVRDLSLSARSAVLDAGGLIPALERYLGTHAPTARLNVDWQQQTLVGTLPPAIEVVAFRILRLAIDNVVRHASASTIRLVVMVAEGILLATVADDGVGFKVGPALTSQPNGGLAIMLGDARLHGGKVQLASTPDVGTTIRLRLPIRT